MKTGFCILIVLLVSKSCYPQSFPTDWDNRPIIVSLGNNSTLTIKSTSGDTYVQEKYGKIEIHNDSQNTGNIPQHVDKTFINERFKYPNIDTSQLERVYTRLITSNDTNGYYTFKEQSYQLADDNVDGSFIYSIKLLTNVLRVADLHKLYQEQALVHSRLSLFYAYKLLQNPSKREKDICLELLKNKEGYSLEVTGDTYKNLGIVYGHLKSERSMVNYDSLAIVTYMKCLPATDLRIADCYFNWSFKLSPNEQIPLLLDSKKLYELHPDFNKDLFYRKTLNNLAFCYIELGEFDLAYSNLQKVITSNLSLGDTLSLAYNYCNLSIIFMQKNKLDSALILINQSLQFQSISNSTSLLVYSNRLKAQIFIANGDYNTAIGELNLALSHYKESYNNDSIELYNIYLVLANCYMQTNKYDEAIEYCSTALLICKNINFNDGVHDCFSLISNNYFYKQEYSLANQLLDSCINYANSNTKLLINYWNKAKSFSSLYKYKSALVNYQKANYYYTLQHNLPNEQSALFFLETALIYQENYMYDSAFVYYSKYLELDKKNIRHGTSQNIENMVNNLILCTTLSGYYTGWDFHNYAHILDEDSTYNYKFDIFFYQVDRALYSYINNYNKDFESLDSVVLSYPDNPNYSSYLKVYTLRLAIASIYKKDQYLFNKIKRYCKMYHDQDVSFLLCAMESAKSGNRLKMNSTLQNIERAQKNGFNDFAFIERNILFNPIKKSKRYLKVIDLMKSQLEAN